MAQHVTIRLLCSPSPTTPAGRRQEQVSAITPVVPPDYPRRQAQLQPQTQLQVGIAQIVVPVHSCIRLVHTR
jgi:hypothetical protein